MMANIYRVVAEHAAPRKGFSDVVQQTGPVISGQLYQDANMQLAYNLLKTFQTPNLTAGQTLHNSLGVPQTAYLQSAQTLSRRNSYAQISSVRLAYGHCKPLKRLDCTELEQLSNILILFIYNDSLDLVVPLAATCTPGIQRNVRRSFLVNQQVASKEKGRSANPTLWMNSFLNHEVNQYSPVLDDAGNPDLDYEQNQHLAARQDIHAVVSGEVEPSRSRVLRKFRKTSNGATYENFVGQPSGDSLAFLRWRRLMSRNIVSGKKLPVLLSGVTGCLPGTSCSFFIGQPFGSMPCRTNSARAKAFNQLPRLTPSLLAASFICWRSSGAIRIWKVGERPSPLGVLSLLMVDMYVRNPVVWILLCTYVITACLQKATPRTVGAVPRRLTSNVNRSNAMAKPQCNQTHPKFQYRFLALSRTDRKARPCRLSVVAHSEREARQVLAPHFILSLAARLPLQGVEEISIPSTVDKTSTVREVRHA